MQKQSVLEEVCRQVALSTLGLDPTPDNVRAAYQKHSTELLSIDEAQRRLVLLAMAVFSAGVSLLSAKVPDLQIPVKVGLTLVAITVAWVGWHANRELGALRRDVRHLLVECELFLGFFKSTEHLRGAALYAEEEMEFPSKGDWRQQSFIIALVAAIGFLVVLWWPLTKPPISHG